MACFLLGISVNRDQMRVTSVGLHNAISISFGSLRQSLRVIYRLISLTVSILQT